MTPCIAYRRPGSAGPRLSCKSCQPQPQPEPRSAGLVTQARRLEGGPPAGLGFEGSDPFY
eukprot:1701112-Rhodomonas_salina.1